MVKILFLEDEPAIREVLAEYMKLQGYGVVCAGDGERALEVLQGDTFDMAVLDIMVPKVSGLEVLSWIQENRPETAVIMLTALEDEQTQVQAFNHYADDYVVKPFDPKEIVARIKAIMRRTGKSASDSDIKEVSYDRLVVNMTRYELKVDGRVVDTPPKELELLYHLASNPNRVYTRDQLLDEVWGFEYYGDSRTVDVHVKRLREKLEGVSDQWTLKTVWGVGYKFEVKE